MENNKVPNNLRIIAKSLKNGQMIPVRTGVGFDDKPSPFLSFLIKYNAIGDIPKNPTVLLSYGCITIEGVKDIFILFLLVRINDDPNMTYETSFSFAEESMREDCLIFSKQKGVQIICLSDNDKHIIRLNMPLQFHLSIAKSISLARSKMPLKWSRQEFLQAISNVYKVAPTPKDLWNLLQEYDGFLGIKVT